MATPDVGQIFKKCFDATKNALRIHGVAGSLDGQITWNTGLGAITHILGPTDEDLMISSNNHQELKLGIDDTYFLDARGTQATVTSGNAETYNLNAIAGGGDTTLLVSYWGTPAQTFTFTSTDFTAYNACTAAEVATVINATAVGFTADGSTGSVVLTGDTALQDATIEITGGTANNAVNGFNFAGGLNYGLCVTYLWTTLKFGAGLGPIVNTIAGPDDQNFYVSGALGTDLALRTDAGSVVVILDHTQSTVDFYNGIQMMAGMGAATHLAGPSDTNLVISGSGTYGITLSSSSTPVLAVDDNGIYFASGIGTSPGHIRGPADGPMLITSGEDYSTYGTYWTYYGVLGDSIIDVYGQQGDHACGAGPFNLAAIAGGAPTTLTVSINGGANETITFASTDPLVVANGGYAALTGAGVAAVINDQATGFYALVSGGLCRVVHKQGARDATIQITGGTARATLGLALATESGLSGVCLHGELYFATGMGDSTVNGTIFGPSDQPLRIYSATNQNLVLSGIGSGHAVLSASGGTITVTDNAGIDVESTAGQNLDLIVSAAGHAYLQSAGGAFNALDDSLSVVANGGYPVTLQAGGGTVTVTDAAGIDVTATANHQLDLTTSGTGHVVVGTANNTLTLNDDAATGITVSGHLHVSGLMVMDAAQVVEIINNELGTAHTYAVATTDYVIGVDCSSDAKAITLPAAATAGTGRVLIIKDQKGNAAAKNITINPTGGEHIDLGHSYVMNANFQSVTLVCTGVAGNEFMVV